MSNKTPNTPAQCLAQWNNRPSLEYEEERLLRVRVAYRCMDWFVRHYLAPGATKVLPLSMLMYIDGLRDEGFVHPLYWEIVRGLKEVVNGTKRHLVYDDVRYNRRRRAVQKLKTPRMRS